MLLQLAAETDVIIENFRPGTLERWGLGPEELHAVNPRLVLARVTGFGQFGPYAHRPGFGTLAEAMSGFAAITGEPDGPPTLPPFGLADSIAALATAYAVMAALAGRERTGEGQVVDLAIIEPILTVLGPQPLWYDQLGYVQPRTGNRSRNNAPRNTYRTADGHWVAVSTSAQSVAERVMRLVGRPELIEEPWFASGTTRAEHSEELDGAVGHWISRHSREEVLNGFEKAEAAVAPIHDVREVMEDPQYRALGTLAEVDDPELGPLRMQNVLFRLSETPGAIRWAAARTARTPTRSWPGSASRRPGSRRCGTRGRCDRPGGPGGGCGRSPLTWLYVPGDRPETVAKALGCGADVVIVDLEDAVAPDRKAYARAATAELLADPVTASPDAVPVHVRVHGEDDIRALTGLPGLSGLRLPKITHAVSVHHVAAVAPGVPLYPLLESALAVEHAYSIASAHHDVRGIALGEADLRADLGVREDFGLDFARSRLVVAARAAALPPPAQSVFPDVRDLDGLWTSCVRGGGSGCWGGRRSIRASWR